MTPDDLPRLRVDPDECTCRARKAGRGDEELIRRPGDRAHLHPPEAHVAFQAHPRESYESDCRTIVPEGREPRAVRRTQRVHETGGRPGAAAGDRPERDRVGAEDA